MPQLVFRLADNRPPQLTKQAGNDRDFKGPLQLHRALPTAPLAQPDLTSNEELQAKEAGDVLEAGGVGSCA